MCFHQQGGLDKISANYTFVYEVQKHNEEKLHILAELPVCVAKLAEVLSLYHFFFIQALVTSGFEPDLWLFAGGVTISVRVIFNIYL